jgi:gluconokinase
MAYIIGIDIGTTNTKAVAFTNKGEVLASAGAAYTAISEQPGYHELDPVQLLEAVISVLKEVTGDLKEMPDAAPGPGGLAGISFSAAMHSLIAVDGMGAPLTRAITWADLRSRPYAEALKASAAGKRIYRQTGTPVHAMSPLCKLLWLKDKKPDIFAKAARFISIKEYIWWRLFGKYQVDHSIASATGLFDIYTLNWYGESLDLAGITPSHLSMPVPSTHSESALLPEYKDSLGLPASLPFIIGGSDGCLANLGSLAVRPGETALTIGTSGAVRMTAAAPQYDPKERIFNYILTDNLFVCGGATNNGGGAVQWFIGQFPGRQDIPGGDQNDRHAGVGEDLTAEAGTVEAGCDGLIFLPYLLGERAPIWNANARGVFFGIRSEHEHRHFMRAVIEGISFSLYQVGASLEETIGPIQHIYASGGFIRSKTWLQMIADVFNRRVYVTNVADASAIGAVILGFYALGMIREPGEATGMIRVHETYEPDEDRHRIYMENYSVYTSLYERLKDLM